MKFILFYADIMYPKFVVNVLTSYTRDILQSAFLQRVPFSGTLCKAGKKFNEKNIITYECTI